MRALVRSQEKKRIRRKNANEESDNDCRHDAGSLRGRSHDARGGHGTRAKAGRRTLKENGMVNKPAPRVF
jgi:hypothetical protein